MYKFDPTLVHEWLRRSARRFPDKSALICGQQHWSYKTLDQYTDHLACALMEMTVARGDRVVIFLDNSPETIISLYGILKAGGVFVVIGSTIKSPKLTYILKNSDANILITHTNKAGIVNEALASLQKDLKVIWVGHKNKILSKSSYSSLSWEQIFSNVTETADNYEKWVNSKFPRTIDVDLATLIYTSGSTGEPKGVISTHHNMVSAARSIIQYVENCKDDIILNVLPLSFDYGLYQVIMTFMFGGTVVQEKSFLYLHKVLEQIPKEKVTGFPIVPTILAMLLKMDNLGKYDFSSLRYMTNTAAALPVSHIRKVRELFPHVRFYSMFGLTECKRVAYMPPEELDNRPSSVGKAMPNCEVFIVDEDGNELPPGKTGELIIRGSNTMQGYWQDPETTAKTYHPGRYPSDRILYSGDYFRKDEQGFLYFLGRKDDMIKSKGERISAREVENSICAMDTVAEAAVIGVPDEILGQAIKAFIVATHGAILTEKQVMKHCAENMEIFMVPKYVKFMDSLPKTPNGKIDKKQLKAMEIE
jgi:long-chain acyl-CoA synthetase